MKPRLIEHAKLVNSIEDDARHGHFPCKSPGVFNLTVYVILFSFRADAWVSRENWLGQQFAKHKNLSMSSKTGCFEKGESLEKRRCRTFRISISLFNQVNLFLP